ncbi:MAG: hypothetical protein V3U96_06570 [Paracoccaceae bacterium]
MTIAQPIGLLNTGGPILALLLLAIALPFLWALFLPEGVPGLFANFILSALVISALVFAYFINWHMGRNSEVTEALLAQPGAFWALYSGWAAKTALFWLPVLVLSVAAQPRRWKEVVW